MTSQEVLFLFDVAGRLPSSREKNSYLLRSREPPSVSSVADPCCGASGNVECQLLMVRTCHDVWLLFRGWHERPGIAFYSIG